MNLAEDLHDVYAMLARGDKPRDRLTVSEWADRHRKVTSEQSSIPGQWVTQRNPPLREIMDCLSKNSRVHEIIVKKSSQVGITEVMINAIGYKMDHDPGPLMVFLPTEQKRDDWKSQKLDPVLRSTPKITEIIGNMRTRDAALRKDRIEFPGGAAHLVGGNSSSSYDQVSARDVFMDDLDRFPEVVGKGHDPVSRARGRAKAYPYKYKLMLASTPTLEEASLIDREYQNSDQRKYYVPCPACGELQTLEWKYIQYDKFNHQPTSAWYVCPECGFQIREHHKQAMLESGKWIAQNPGNKRRGYHISALYTPTGLGPSWLDLAIKWNEIHHDPVTGAPRKGEQAQLMSFINEDLGEVWKDQSSSIKPHDLARRKEDIPSGDIPPGVLAITIGIDTQDTWLDVQVVGWRPWHDGRPAWSVIDWFQIKGDTSTIGPWDELESVVNKEWINAYGKSMRPKAAAIDNRGHRGEHVKAFIQRETLKIPVYRVQGSTSIIADFISRTPSQTEKSPKGKTYRGAYGLWNIGTEAVKDTIYAAIVSDDETPAEERRLRFSADLPSEYFTGLMSEVKNPKTRRYEVKRGAQYKRNEPLDGLGYAIAIGHHKEVMIAMTRRRLHRSNGASVYVTVPDLRYWARHAALLEPDTVQQEQPTQTERDRPQRPEPTTPKPRIVHRRTARSRYVK